ncbi:MAG: SRPBCC family protein, partial [Actinomycetota bacterium]|nr:SRPBCC family protein [Actinomycetota bacterium]
MELTNEFRVSVPPADAWRVLTDAERIAPMLPGAQLQEIEGDELRGIIKVKVGPITAQYKGTASWVERDETAGRAVLRASGRDTRGQGNASATIT